MSDRLGFEGSDPVSQQMDEAILNTLKKKLKNEKIMSCLVLRNNNMVFEFYKNNKIGPALQHINSCTKSIVGALIGICLKSGLISDINIPITEYFGDLIMRQSDERKSQITLYHLLTMSAGFHWPEFGEWHYFSPMEYSKNILSYILDRELEANPGEKMNYNSGCSHLLSAIVQKVTGMSTEGFAKQYLFEPLGITESHWYRKQGVHLGANGINFKSVDMLKFGYLFLKEGTVNGREIITKDWVRESVMPRYLTYEFIGHYGYQWWMSSVALDEDKVLPFYFALGFGGQFIIIVPQYDMVVVFTSREYKNTMLPMHYFKEYIVKAVCENIS
jgi:CubicO group peptidase (beta-lactamase class C family)